jgi:hypothetical protein
LLGFQKETILKLVRLLLQGKVAVEGPREMIANSKLSQYTVEAVLFENFEAEGDFEMPSEAAQVQRPKLWSAEHVMDALIYVAAATLSQSLV